LKGLKYKWLERGGKKLYPHTEYGLTQGSPLSPVLANIFLEWCNLQVEHEGIQYADDGIWCAGEGELLSLQERRNFTWKGKGRTMVDETMPVDKIKR